MHQSPQKQLPGRRDRYADPDDNAGEARGHANRGGQPKARKFNLRDDPQREQRPGRQQR